MKLFNASIKVEKPGDEDVILTIMYQSPSQVLHLSQWLSVTIFVLCPGEICVLCDRPLLFLCHCCDY